MEYWKECITEALEDVGIEANEKQINEISEWVEGAHENYSMAHGYDVISSPSESRSEKELRELKAKNEERELWNRTTKICPDCVDGIQRDGWGREHSCDMCNGRGRR